MTTISLISPTSRWPMSRFASLSTKASQAANTPAPDVVQRDHLDSLSSGRYINPVQEANKPPKPGINNAKHGLPRIEPARHISLPVLAERQAPIYVLST